MLGRGRAIVVGVFVAGLVVLGLPVAASAAEIVVTTTADVIDPNDGVTSLREAISLANEQIDPQVITLAAFATYRLSLCGADEDSNAGGDLDHLRPDAIQIDGNGATVRQTCDGQRVLQFHHTNGVATVNALTVTGGEGDAAAISFVYNLKLHDVTVAGNDAGAGASLVSENGAGSLLALESSTIGPNIGTGIRLLTSTTTIADSTISGNTLNGVELGSGFLNVGLSRFEGNGRDGMKVGGGPTMENFGSIQLGLTVVRNNGAAGMVCAQCLRFDTTSSSISRNASGGIAIQAAWDRTNSPRVRLDSTKVFDNRKTGSGAGLSVSGTWPSETAPPAEIVVQLSSLYGNIASGAQGRGGAVHTTTGNIIVGQVTIAGNRASVAGGGLDTGQGNLTLQNATIVDNTAPAGANIAVARDFAPYGSIVSLGTGGPDCVVAGAIRSGGYNIGQDGSCGFTAPGDNNAAGDPMLEPLEDNGGAPGIDGPTLTRRPAVTSPAVDIIPAPCLSSLDQRGTTRPQGPKCDAGAVEIAGPGGGLPTTGTNVHRTAMTGLVLILAGIAVLTLARRRTPA